MSDKRELDLDSDEIALQLQQAQVRTAERLASLASAVLPIVEKAAQLTEQLTPFARLQMEVGRIAKELAPAVDASVRIGSAVAAGFARLGAAIEQVPERMQGPLLAIAKAGWYIDRDMTLPQQFRLNDLIESGEAEKATTWLADYYRARAPDIERRLAERHPTRAALISAAFAAHGRSEYALSVPVLLSQAEGIAFDERKRQLFSRRLDQGLVGLVDLEAKDFDSVILKTLVAEAPINYGPSARGEDFDGLNRHAVLHGESTSYGTELNSLKAISLISFTSFALAQEAPVAEEGEL